MLEKLKPKPPEVIPVAKTKMKLRETVKPANREVDRGGAVLTIISTLMVILGFVVEQAPDIVQLLNDLAVNPAIVALFSKITGILGYIVAGWSKMKDGLF